MAGPRIPRDVLDEIRRQAQFRQKAGEAIARIERQQMLEAALRYLDCIRSGGTSESCRGIYRLTPRPPAPFRKELKAALSAADYKELSRVWRER